MAARKNGGLRGAFTLFEILAVIAIIAMVSIFTVLNFSFLDNLESRPLPAVLKNAARSARLKADLSGRETALFFDADAREFVLRDYESGAELERLTLSGKPAKPAGGAAEKPETFSGAGASGLEISFIPNLAALENGNPDLEEIESIPCIRFYPDGANSDCLIFADFKNGTSKIFILESFAEVPVEKK